jgi:glycerol-3-phosphate acyltransferase PlsY
MWFLGPNAFAIGSAILAALIFITHRENISRLASGLEPKIGQKKEDGRETTSHQ